MIKTKKELKEEFYNKFTCLVKPVAYTFTKGGKKREVEGSCEVRDSVWSWIEKALPQEIRKVKMTKLKATILYLLDKIGPITKAKLEALLYFCDFDHFEKHEKPLFKGVKWIKGKGPELRLKTK